MHKKCTCSWPWHLQCLESLPFCSATVLIFPYSSSFKPASVRLGAEVESCFFTVLNDSLVVTCPVWLTMKPCRRVCPLVSSRLWGGALKSSVSRSMARAITGCYSVLTLGVCYQNRQFFLPIGTFLVGVMLPEDSWKSPCRVRSLYSSLFNSLRSPFSWKVKERNKSIVIFF